MKLLAKIDFNKVNIILISLLSISLLFSRFFISITQILLLISWLLNSDFKSKIEQLKNNKPLLIFLSIILIFLFSLSYTTDFKYAKNDLILKIPFLLLPLVISSVKFTFKEIQFIFLFFVLAVFCKIIISYYILIFFDVKDMREISYKVSHIRFSLIINFAYIISIYYFTFFRKTLNKYEKLLNIFLILWFGFFLFILQSFTGLIIFFIINFIFLLKMIFANKNKFSRYFFITIIILIPLFLTVYFYNLISNFNTFKQINFTKLEQKTLTGNNYYHDTLNLEIENNNYIWLYICDSELKEEWNKKSKISYDSLDYEGNCVRYTIIRYLNSKGLRKDKEGILQLSDLEIEQIENGVANYRENEKFNISYKIENILWQLDNYFKGGSPNGHSLTQRFEYWSIGFDILKKHPFFGVGIGDIKNEYEKQYIESNSKLNKEYRKRAHNQFFTFFITYGIIGGSFILFCIFYPFIKNKKYKEFIPSILFIIMLISMLNEDSFETQIGITFFMLFYSLLILNKNTNLQNV